MWKTLFPVLPVFIQVTDGVSSVQMPWITPEMDL